MPIRVEVGGLNPCFVLFAIVVHMEFECATCQPRGQCASVDDRGTSSECKPLIYCSHNSHSLSNYSVDISLDS